MAVIDYINNFNQLPPVGFLAILDRMQPLTHTVTIMGSKLHYWEYNHTKKQTIVMVHGFRGTHHGLESIIKLLPEYRVIIADLPGFGDSSAFPNHPHTIESYAKVMQKLIQHVGLKQPFLVGHSMGATVVAAMITSYPEMTPKAVFINPVSASPMEGIGALKIFPGIVYHRMAGKYLPEKLGMKILTNKQLFLLGSAAMTKTREKELRKWIHWNHVTYMKRFSDRNSLLEAFESSSYTTIADFAHKTTIPLLFIAGVQDSIAPIASQRKLVATLPNAELVEIDNVGHIVHYEKPQLAADAIKRFLAK